MTRRTVLGCSVVVALLAGGLAVARAQSRPTNQFYSQNPGAEDGTISGWTGSGWGAERYDAVGVNKIDAYPEYQFASPKPRNDWLFTSYAPSQSLSQQVSLEDAAQEIDSGKSAFFVVGWLGGSGPSEAGALVTAQPTDSTGAPIGSPTQLGPPTAADREGHPALAGCAANLVLEPGTRGVILTLTSTAATSARDAAFVDNVIVGDNGIFDSVGYPPAEGQNCERHRESYPTPTPSPTSSPTPGSTASPTPTATVAPTVTVTPAPPPHVGQVRLTHRRLAFSISTTASFRAVILRRGEIIRRKTVTATAAGRISRRIRRLPDGRYRVIIRAGGRVRADVRRRIV